MQSKKNEQILSLVSLKGIFILLIVLHNTISYVTGHEAIPGASFIRDFGGQFGDAMFFMLSGFLFGYSYRDRIHHKQISLADYLNRRLHKLYPLYLLSNIAAMLLMLIRFGISALPIKKTVLMLLLQLGGGLEADVPYNSPTWFISALFFCYIVFYFVAFWSKNNTQYYCALIICIVWGYILITQNLLIPFCYAGNGIALLNFFIGALLAEISFKPSRRAAMQLQAVCITGLVLSFLLMFRYGITIMSGDFPTACSFAICPAILYLSISDGLISRVLQWKPFVFIGKLSISIFFWHAVCFDILRILVFRNGVYTPHYLIYIPVLLIFSLLSNQIIENKKYRFVRHLP